MKTNRINRIAGIVIALLINVLVSCGHSDSTSSGFEGDTVSFKIVTLSDSSCFVRANGDNCNVYADITAAIPLKFGNNESASIAVTKFFMQYLLDANDSITVDAAVKQCVDNVLHQYNFKDTPQGDDEHDDLSNSELVKNYINSSNISIIFNRDNIITFCKRDVIKKDNKVTSVTHRYFSFDLESCSIVELNKLFKDEMMTSLCKALKIQLARNNKVENDDQLNDCGFFNIDNMTVTSNFYFDGNAVVWSYLPNELAVETLGEPQIRLDFEELEPYMSENSILKRLM